MIILPDSVEINGDFSAIIVKGANPEVPPTDTELVYMDPVCGIDSVFQSVTVSFNDRIVETISEYPRLVKMKKVATKSPSMHAFWRE